MTIRRRAHVHDGSGLHPEVSRCEPAVNDLVLNMSPGLRTGRRTGWVTPMFRFLRVFQNLFRVFQNLYVKLIAAAAIGVLLVAGMMLNEQLSSASVARSNEQSRNQNLVVKEVMLAQ